LDQNLRIILNNLREAIFSVTNDGRIRLANQAATRLFGISGPDWVGRPVGQIHVDEESARRFENSQTESLRRDGLAEGECVMRGGNGKPFPAETTTVLLRDGQDREAGRILVVRDISHRQRNEEQIRSRARQLMVLHQVGALVNRSLDLDQVLTAALEKLRSLLSCDVAACYLASSVGGRETLTLHHGAGFTRETLENERLRGPVAEPSPESRAAASRQVVLVEARGDSPVESLLLRQAGVRSSAHVPIESHGRLAGVLALGRTRLVRFSGEDVDLFLPLGQLMATAIANARLYADLLRHQELLARLSSQILTAQEEERRHLSRELHDGVGQSLSALKLGLEMASRDSTELSGDVKANLARSLDIVMGTISELRRIAHDLRPSILDDLGLIPTLEWFVHRHQDQTGLAIRLRVSGDIPRLSPQHEVNIFRIVQEAMANVVKHADARAAVIRVRGSEKAIHLTIADDGRGFHPATAGTGTDIPGLGLVGMEERVHLMGGHLRIRSRPGSGTVIAVRAPLGRPSTAVSTTEGTPSQGEPR
jgi:PAS domain S-box-containing protein